MTQKSINAIYENGTLKLRGKLPLRNQAKVRLFLVPPSSAAARTYGLLKVPRRVAIMVAESDEFSILNS